MRDMAHRSSRNFCTAAQLRQQRKRNAHIFRFKDTDIGPDGWNCIKPSAIVIFKNKHYKSLANQHALHMRSIHDL